MKAPKRKRVKDCFIDLTETEETTGKVTGSVDESRGLIKQFRFEGKTISCLERDGHHMALLEALCRVYFPQCTVQAFSEALGTALHAPITELSPTEEALFINYYHLPTDALKCRRVVDLRLFSKFFLQLAYMLQDREKDEAASQTGDTEVVFTEKVSVPGGMVATDDTPNQLTEAGAVHAPSAVERQAVVIENVPETTVMPVPMVDASIANGDGNARQESLPTEEASQQELVRMSPTNSGTAAIDSGTCKRMRFDDELVSTSPLSELLNRTSQRSTTNSPRSSPSASMLPMLNSVLGTKVPYVKDDIAVIEATEQQSVAPIDANNGDKRVICID